MIDEILGACSNFDMVSPTISLVSWATRTGYRFQIPVNEMAGSEIEWMLRKNGIRTWGLVLDQENTIMINVSKKQASKAHGILQAAGVPVENPPKQARQSRPKRKPQSGGVWGVFDVFER